MAAPRSLVACVSLLWCVSCGGDAGPPPTRAHLFDRPLAGSHWEQAGLPGDLARLLAQETVDLRHEWVREVDWKPVANENLTEGRMLLHGDLRFPYLCDARLVDRDESNLGHTGRTLAQDERPLPGPDEILITPEGVSVVQGADAPWPGRLNYAYTTSTAEVIRFLGLEEQAHASRLELDGQSRRVRSLTPGSKLSWILELEGEQPALRFEFGARALVYRAEEKALGLIPPLEERGTDHVPLKLVVHLEHGLDSSVIGEFQLGGDALNRFSPARLDLSAWRGEQIALTFEVLRPEGGELPPWVPFLAEPVLDPGTADARPNVIFVVLDTLRADALSCYGGREGLTPNLDALAARGVRFADCMSPASATLASHASFFTSTYPSEHRLWFRERLPQQARTLAEILRDAGYATLAQTEGVFLHPRFGLDQGFDVFDASEHKIMRTFRRAMQRVEESEGPFFLFLQTYCVHAPYAPPPELRERFVSPYAGPLPEVCEPFIWRASGREPDAQDVRYLLELYQAEVALADRWIGKLVEFLDERQLMQNTLLLVTSDHGEEFAEHGGFGHGRSVYQELLHVPLIAHFPGVFEGGQVFEHPVHGLDLMPTCLELAGLPLPDGTRGLSLTSVPDERQRPLFSPFWPPETGRPMAALRQGSRKLVLRDLDDLPGAPGELYELSSDPHEIRDLAQQDDSTSRLIEAVNNLLERYPALYDAERGDTSDLEAGLEAMGYGGGD